jgi:hypothetical protein
MDLKSEGINVGLAVAGVFGALLTASKRAGEDIGRSVLSIVGGAASANYVTPLILKVTKLDDSPQYAYAIAFLLGFAGLRAVQAVSDKLFPHEPTQPTHSRKRHR